MQDEWLGLHVREFAIGMQGAISGIFVLRKSRPRDIVGMVVVGGFTANYCWPLVSVALSPLLVVSHDMAVYIAGVCGWVFCLGMLKCMDLWTQRTLG